MDLFYLFELIPDDVKTKVRDELVKFVTDQAKKHFGDDIANKLKKLRSDASFNQKFEQGLQRAVERFFAEYRLEDEDLVAAITVNKEFFQNEEILAALLTVIKNPGAYLDKEQEIVLQSFASVLPERLNRPRVNRAVSYFIKCLAQEVWALPELQPIYSLQFQRMTAEATREQVGLQKAQLQALTEINAGIKETLLQLTTAMEQKLLAAPTLPALPAPTPKPYHNLPRPDYACFIGRETELAWLRQRLYPDDRAWQIAITGIGGVGKSALALAIAHEYCEKYDALPPEERFDAIIWISAKEEVLTAQGKEKAGLPETVLRTLEDVYTVIARTLEREDITRALPDEQSSVVGKALKTQRTLLVMDNLESVQDERIKPFLRNLPSPTKALITSREWLDVADVWQLKGLSAAEADRLIVEESALRQISLDGAQRQRTYDLTSGLPLPIKLAIARLSGGESFSAIERWLGDAVGDLPEYCIAGQAELAKQRDPNSWKLLLACSLFDRNAGALRDALGYIANLSLADRDAGLAQLQRLFLISQTEHGRFWVLPIVQRYASESFSMKNSHSLVSRWLKWLEKYTSAEGGDFRFKIEKLIDFGVEYPNIYKAINLCKQRGNWQSLLLLADNTWSYPYLRGLINDYQEIVSFMNYAVNETGNQEYKGYLLVHLGRLNWLRGDYNNALECLKQSEAIMLQTGYTRYLPSAWTMMAHILYRQGQYDLSENLARKMLATGIEKGDLYLQYEGNYRLSANATMHHDHETAAKYLDDAQRLAEEMGGTRQLIAVMYRRASSLVSQGRFDEAEIVLTQAIQDNTRIGEFRHIADHKLLLAFIYQHKGNYEASQQLAKDALEIYQKIGMSSSFEFAANFYRNIPVTKNSTDN